MARSVISLSLSSITCLHVLVSSSNFTSDSSDHGHVLHVSVFDSNS
ncbi:hypothetical protein RchiOBHm_Chr2g0125171 [Rosa chinensis]|uniref:Uncharacterized protein n=1 Tax=Rosa chinensis TaxID=74649 RepID=A0A2P6RTH4_ROSCH|nr:hypothetical protein RchiOBHm_Chr2g0125171 [Rosa chinensis]